MSLTYTAALIMVLIALIVIGFFVIKIYLIIKPENPLQVLKKQNDQLLKDNAVLYKKMDAQ